MGKDPVLDKISTDGIFCGRLSLVRPRQLDNLIMCVSPFRSHKQSYAPLIANSAFLSLISPDAGGAAAADACIRTANVRREQLARHGFVESLLNLRLTDCVAIAKDIVKIVL
jgi:hypothetical protein